jgi:hypothetical protein
LPKADSHPVKVATHARHSPAIKLILNQSAPADANVVAQLYGKRIKQIARFPMQILQDCAKLMKQLINQIRKTINPPRKTRPAKQSFHQTKFVQNKARTLKVTAKVQHRSDGNSNDFGICDGNPHIFPMSALLEKIVNKTVYCKSAFAHIGSSPLFLSGKQNFRRRLFLFQISKSITGNLGYL